MSSVSAIGEVIACAMWRCVRLLSSGKGDELVVLKPPAAWGADWFNSCSLGRVDGGDAAGSLRLCAGGDNAIIGVWLLSGAPSAWTGEVAQQCTGLKDDVLSVQLSREADQFCSSSNGGAVLLWAADDLSAPLRAFEWGGQPTSVRHAGWCYPEEGGGAALIVAVLAGGGGIIMWRSTDGTAPLARQRACGGSALAWCGAMRGGTRLVTTGADKRVRVWSVPELHETACFYADGAFGSSDGIGGEGAFETCKGQGPEQRRLLAVGDGSGRLHVLHIHLDDLGSRIGQL